MEMITDTMAKLTNLEIFLGVVCFGMVFVISVSIGQVEKMKSKFKEMQLINTRFYNMYMELSMNSLAIVAKWQQALKEKEDLIKVIEQNKKNLQ